MSVTQNVDERREPLYDTLVVTKQTTVASGTRLFISGNDSRGFQLTNVSGNGELPSPERMTVLGIRIDFFDTPTADIIGLTKNLMLRLIVSGKARILAPLNYFPSGAANSGNGVADARAILQLPENYQIDIEAGEKFYCDLVGANYLLTDATTGLTMRVMLDGLHSVPVN